MKNVKKNYYCGVVFALISAILISISFLVKEIEPLLGSALFAGIYSTYFFFKSAMQQIHQGIDWDFDSDINQ